MKGIPREVVALGRRTITNSKEMRAMRFALNLNDYQRSVLLGCLLGDGGLYSDGWNKNYRLKIDQGEKQREYLFWKFEIFRNCCSSQPSYQKKNRSWRFRTISHLVFNEYARHFYLNKKKKVPKSILNTINSISLAVWFMDDGTKGPSNGYTLNTQNFSYEENRYLSKFLENKFSLKVSIHKDKKWWRLYISSSSALKFKELITPYMIPSMNYKLYAIDPVETTRRPLMASIRVKI